MGVDSEPWVFKGGLSGDVQVLNMLIFNFQICFSAVECLLVGDIWFIFLQKSKALYFVCVLQMLLPIGSCSELFIHPPPLFPTSRLYNVRPYHNKDKVKQKTYPWTLAKYL